MNTPIDSVPVADLAASLLSGHCTVERVTLALTVAAMRSYTAALQAEIKRVQDSLKPAVEFPIRGAA